MPLGFRRRRPWLAPSSLLSQQLYGRRPPSLLMPFGGTVAAASYRKTVGQTSQMTATRDTGTPQPGARRIQTEN